ncbi:Hypothetical_protein [Hexamita inflata]|uniref:Hypothetical_protein n=1 Tax=Hexamita inflata TaxID=28002 RepID=A0AA86Q641_9EUKA|nr:Hypothetical protein HINF_LOCUS37707 [Hexamita inflata]
MQKVRKYYNLTIKLNNQFDSRFDFRIFTSLGYRSLEGRASPWTSRVARPGRASDWRQDLAQPLLESRTTQTQPSACKLNTKVNQHIFHKQSIRQQSAINNQYAKFLQVVNIKNIQFISTGVDFHGFLSL